LSFKKILKIKNFKDASALIDMDNIE